MFDKQILQIAGVLDKNDAFTIIDAGIKYIGFPLVLGYHIEDMDKHVTRSVINALPAETIPVLITYLDKAKDIITLSEYIGAKMIQVHGDISLAELTKLKNDNMNIKIIKSIIIHNNSKVDFDLLNVQSKLCDYFITDTHDELSGAAGATGKTHDWNISRDICAQNETPVILAGGLNHTNVADAILHVNPAGVDAHTGVEDASGRKSHNKMCKFREEAMSAFSK